MGLAEAARMAAPAQLVERLATDLSPAALRAGAAELAAMAPAAIIAVGPPVIHALQAAAPGVPIVAMDLETDPVAAGWVASVSRPGGSLTGIFLDAADVAAKCLQILGEFRPGLARVGLLWDPGTGNFQRDAVIAMATQLGIGLEVEAVAEQPAIAPAVGRLAAAGAQAVLALSSPLFLPASGLVAAAIRAAALPSIMLFREYPQHGGLIGYGPDFPDLYRRAGAMAQRIAEGARPADLPLERPVRFVLSLNLGTARALGLEAPPTLLARADEVID